MDLGGSKGGGSRLFCGDEDVGGDEGLSICRKLENIPPPGLLGDDSLALGETVKAGCGFDLRLF